MLKFLVMDGSVPAADWPLRHAHLLGPDDVAIPAEIVLLRGEIQCTKRIAGASAFAVMYNAGDAVVPRQLMLRTCLLPERGEPYLLSLELARHQVMLLLNKLEEWGLFDQQADGPLMVAVTRAVESFTAAAVAKISPEGSADAMATAAHADRLARRAVALAVEAGEQLALAAAAVVGAKRASGKLEGIGVGGGGSMGDTDDPAIARPGKGGRAGGGSSAPPGGSMGVVLADRPAIGCVVNTSVFSPELCNAILGSCDFLTLPMRWVDMEPSEGKYAFAKTDKWIEWAILTAKLPVVGGPVLDLSRRSVPKWLAVFEHDYETLRDMVFEYLRTIVTRYRRTVSTWTICSGLHAPGGLNLTPEQAMDLTKICVAIVKKLQPTAKVNVEIAQPFGEYTASPNGRGCLPPSIYAELIKQLAIPADALSVRVQLGSGELGRATRDVLTTLAMLDRFASVDKPIAISALGWPSGVRAGPDDEAGCWNGAWADRTQAEFLAQLGAALVGRPYVQSICWHELYDVPTPAPTGVVPGEMPMGGVVTSAGQSKPALAALAALRAKAKAAAGV